MKFILLVLLILNIEVLAYEVKEKTDFYLNSRIIFGNMLYSDDEVDESNKEAVFRFGVRHRRILGNNILFDTDVRVVFEHEDINNNIDNNIYLAFKRASFEFPLSIENSLYVKIGRMPFKDHRTWWYDNELDAIKLSHYETLLSWDILAGGRFSDNRISSSDQRVGLEDIRYLVSHIDYHYYFNHHIEFFGIYEDSDKEDLYKDHKLGWLGMRTYGKSTNVEYWTDFAFMSGDIGYIDEASYSASGYGLDLGAIYRTNAISFGVDIAYGSADISDEEDSKKLYLQPKISNNKSSIIGTTRYRYYGELVDPQLSNLKIISLFAGSKIFSNNWIEVAYHNYQQNEADTNFESSRFLVKPNGESADIGTEFDVILGGKYDNKSELQLVFSSFTAGDAFEGVAIEKEAYRAHIDYKLYW